MSLVTKSTGTPEVSDAPLTSTLYALSVNLQKPSQSISHLSRIDCVGTREATQRRTPTSSVSLRKSPLDPTPDRPS